jgi:hypothetical protein
MAPNTPIDAQIVRRLPATPSRIRASCIEASCVVTNSNCRGK